MIFLGFTDDGNKGVVSSSIMNQPPLSAKHAASFMCAAESTPPHVRISSICVHRVKCAALHCNPAGSLSYMMYSPSAREMKISVGTSQLRGCSWRGHDSVVVLQEGRDARDTVAGLA